MPARDRGGRGRGGGRGRAGGAAVRPLRILHVVANRWWTGSADPALDLARALKQRGHAVWFACIPGDVLEAHVRASGVELVENLSLERTMRPWRIAAQIRRLGRVLRERAGSTSSTPIRRTTTGSRRWRPRRHRRPRGPHGAPSPGGPRRSGRPLARWAGRTPLMAVSEGIADRLRAVGAPPARVAVVPGAVDAERFTPRADGRPVRAELGLGDAPVVGCVARMVPGRGHDVLLPRDGDPARAAAVGAPGPGGSGRAPAGPGDPRTAARARIRPWSSLATEARISPPCWPPSIAPCFSVRGPRSPAGPFWRRWPSGVRSWLLRSARFPKSWWMGRPGGSSRPRRSPSRPGLETALVERERARRMGEAGRRRVEARFTPSHRATRVEAIYGQVLAKEALPRR